MPIIINPLLHCQMNQAMQNIKVCQYDAKNFDEEWEYFEVRNQRLLVSCRKKLTGRYQVDDYRLTTWGCDIFNQMQRGYYRLTFALGRRVMEFMHYDAYHSQSFHTYMVDEASHTVTIGNNIVRLQTLDQWKLLNDLDKTRTRAKVVEVMSKIENIIQTVWCVVTKNDTSSAFEEEDRVNYFDSLLEGCNFGERQQVFISTLRATTEKSERWRYFESVLAATPNVEERRYFGLWFQDLALDYDECAQVGNLADNQTGEKVIHGIPAHLSRAQLDVARQTDPAVHAKLKEERKDFIFGNQNKDKRFEKPSRLHLVHEMFKICDDDVPDSDDDDDDDADNDDNNDDDDGNNIATTTTTTNTATTSNNAYHEWIYTHEEIRYKVLFDNHEKALRGGCGSSSNSSSSSSGSSSSNSASRSLKRKK